MKIRRQIFNALKMKIADNTIHVHECRTLNDYCRKLGGIMKLGGKEFFIVTGKPLNQITTTYRIIK